MRQEEITDKDVRVGEAPYEKQPSASLEISKGYEDDPKLSGVRVASAEQSVGDDKIGIEIESIDRHDDREERGEVRSRKNDIGHFEFCDRTITS